MTTFKTGWLALGLTVITALACGKSKDDDETIVIERDGRQAVATGTDADQTKEAAGKPAAGPQTSTQTSTDTTDGSAEAPKVDPNQPLAGVFQQVENHQAKIRINSDLILDTNLELAHPSGNGTRISPKFPQALRPDAAREWYSSIGYYNDGNSVFKNIEIKVRLYAEDRLLDVTLSIPPTTQPGTTPGTTPPSTTPCCDPCCYTYDPCNPCGWDYCCQPCCNPCQPQPGSGTGGTNPLLYQYRYERVPAPGTPAAG